MLRLTKTTTSEDHEEIFLRHYSRLRDWALALTNRDHQRAEDLVHDAFVQFTLSQPNISIINNLNGYLYTMLRNLHLSEMRRVDRIQRRALSIVDYDSAELGLRVVDMRQQIRVQDELRRVCQFACVRKETSKAGSVLILRFLHGYYPREIAQIMRTTRQVVEERLRTARIEAQQYLKDPRSVVFMRSSSIAVNIEAGFARTSDELLLELRNSIFSSRQGECLPFGDLKKLYASNDNSALDQQRLAHLVSCRHCLDAVNELLKLPLLAERFPTDTIGRDTSSGGGDDGDRPGGTGGAWEKDVRLCRKREREVFEHRPAELCISVNGHLMATQKVGSALCEQTLTINLNEKIEFIEVLGEQEVRLLFFSIDEMPPNGTHSRSVEVELSDERTLSATLSFSNPWPTLQVVYFDPLISAESAKLENELQLETSPLAPHAIESNAQQPKRPQFPPGVLAALIRRWLSNLGFLLRPANITAVIALILITALVTLRLRTPTASAAELLQRSAFAEAAFSNNRSLVVHRTINLEERSPNGGQVVGRHRIESWQSSARELKVRRVYDEKNNLIAGEWSKSDGTSTVYQRGAAPQSRSAAELVTNAVLETGELWRLDVSARNFETLVGDTQSTMIEETADSYILKYTPSNPVDGRLLRASLKLKKDDLHAIGQELTIQNGGQVREFKFVEAAFVQSAPGSVDENIYVTDPELLAVAQSTNQREGHLHDNDKPLSQPAVAIASHELEVEVTYLLNRIKANLGEQVSMTRTTGGALRVEALVETEGRKAELLNALGSVMNNPAVRVDVRTVAEATKQSMGKDSPASDTNVQEISVPNATMPAAPELRKYFSSRLVGDDAIEQEITRYTNRVMSHSRQALLQASALKRLVERFSPADIRALAPAARSKWVGMIQEHTQAYRREVSALRQQLTIFGVRTGSDNPDVANAVQAAARLVELSYSNDDAVRSSFTISAESHTTVGIKSDKFWRSLSATEKLVSVIETEYRN